MRWLKEGGSGRRKQQGADSPRSENIERHKGTWLLEGGGWVTGLRSLSLWLSLFIKS